MLVPIVDSVTVATVHGQCTNVRPKEFVGL